MWIVLSMGVFAGATAIVKTTKLPLMMSSDFGSLSLGTIGTMLERLVIAD